MSFAPYLPKQDDQLKTWATNFSANITATPTAFGFSAANATTYAGLLEAFSTALAAATDPSTRGHATIAAKDEAKVALLAISREYGQSAKSNLNVSNAQRIALGVNVRKQAEPIGIPDSSPGIQVVKVDQNIVDVILYDAASGKRKKPGGVSGAMVVSWVGNNPAPASPAEWVSEGNTSKTRIRIEFPREAEPFGKVQISAAWCNPRMQTGGFAVPVTTNLGTWQVAAGPEGGTPLQDGGTRVQHGGTRVDAESATIRKAA